MPGRLPGSPGMGQPTRPGTWEWSAFTKIHNGSHFPKGQGRCGLPLPGERGLAHCTSKGLTQTPSLNWQQQHLLKEWWCALIMMDRSPFMSPKAWHEREGWAPTFHTDYIWKYRPGVLQQLTLWVLWSNKLAPTHCPPPHFYSHHHSWNFNIPLDGPSNILALSPLASSNNLLLCSSSAIHCHHHTLDLSNLPNPHSQYSPLITSYFSWPSALKDLQSLETNTSATYHLPTCTQALSPPLRIALTLLLLSLLKHPSRKVQSC